MWRHYRSTSLTFAVLFLVSCANPGVDPKLSSDAPARAEAKSADIVVSGTRIAAAPMVMMERDANAPPPPPPPAPGMYPQWSPP